MPAKSKIYPVYLQHVTEKGIALVKDAEDVVSSRKVYNLGDLLEAQSRLHMRYWILDYCNWNMKILEKLLVD